MKTPIKVFAPIIALFCISLSCCETAQQVLGGIQSNTGQPTTYEIVAGLKQALSIGAANSSNKLSSVDGFFENAAVKILMPEEAKKVESTLRNIGLGNLVDKAILSMNRAAEEASKSAKPIFTDAIKNMTISDAVGILRGSEHAATEYFRQKTTEPLTAAFQPVIENALKKTNATRYWEDVFSAYNKFSTKPVNTNLAAYVTEKSLSGIFYEVAQEEEKIRKDPAARITDLLKKVFGS